MMLPLTQKNRYRLGLLAMFMPTTINYMKQLLFVSLILIALHSSAQNFYFSKENYTDSAALGKAMPILAKQLISNNKEKNRLSFFYNQLRYQIVAEEYKASIESLDSCKEINKSQGDAIKALRFQFETFAVTKELQKTDNRPFDKLYVSCFNKLYAALPEKATLTVDDYFYEEVPALYKKLKKVLDDCQQKNKDSIDLDDAKKLCLAYSFYHVYKHIKHLAAPLLEQATNSKYIIQDSVLITMKDGGQLTACIVRKKSNPEPLPAVIMYNIYADGFAVLDARDIANEGFVGIIVNTRGKKLSKQAIEPFEHDANDAYEMLDWISKQPWCNGKIGMYGGSYLGFGQWSAVRKMHPALKTIVPQVAVAPGIDYPNPNGVFMSYMLRWIHYVSNNKLSDYDEFGNMSKWDSVFNKWYVTGKSFRSLDSLEGRPNAIFQRWLAHPAHDGYWQNMVPYQKEFANINIPVLTTTGYYDADQRGAFYYFNQHHQYNKNANHYLLIGPYDHGGAQRAPKPVLEGYTIDSVANISITNLVFEWFNYILKDSAKPAILKDRVNYEVMGTNEWKHAPSLSKMNNDTLTFYLSNVKSKTYYQLQNKKPVTNEYISQEINLADRTDAKDYAETLILDSVLRIKEFVAYASAPLEKTVTMNGSFLAEINTVINKKDMDLTVQLFEQLPNGQYFALGNDYNIVRASYAKNRNQRQLLQPGKLEKICMNNTYFVCRQLSKGSRIIALVGINKNRDWQINYGTGKDVSDETIADGKIPLQIKWMNSSCIKLPIQQ